MWVFIYILLVHWFSDFILQTRHMATRKSSSIYYLTLHVGVYSTSTFLFWLPFLFLIPKLTITILLISLLITFVTHWLTDFITSKITTRFYKSEKFYEFFSTIGFDQWLHALTLFSTYQYLILN
jgi:K+-sensing histidine kinase KdpD